MDISNGSRIATDNSGLSAMAQQQWFAADNPKLSATAKLQRFTALELSWHICSGSKTVNDDSFKPLQITFSIIVCLQCFSTVHIKLHAHMESIIPASCT
jgi:hypothetical protein